MDIKRLAVLIGNTNSLPGIQNDLEDFEHFLNSNIGGVWNSDTEICKAYNVSRKELLNSLKKIRNANFDYLIFYFSGHGGLDRSSGSTILELNRNGDTIDISDLAGISIRQLNIFDCCRILPESIQKSVINESAMFSAENLCIKSRDLYNARIMASAKQQINLYACSCGECANATGHGSIYTKNLLKAAKSFNTSDVLVLDAHKKACKPTAFEAREYKENQHPDYDADDSIPKNKQLILSMRNIC